MFVAGVVIHVLQEMLNTSDTRVKLMKLTPFTNYIVSISCVVADAAHGYWSDESNVSARTAQYGCNFVTAFIQVMARQKCFSSQKLSRTKTL